MVAEAVLRGLSRSLDRLQKARRRRRSGDSDGPHALRSSSELQGAINAALEALARGLALELAPVRVNAVSPGLLALYAMWYRVRDDLSRTRLRRQ